MKKQDKFAKLETNPVLIDVNSQGRIIKWEEYHKGSLYLSHIYRNIAELKDSPRYYNKAKYTRDCGNHLVFVRDKRNGQKRLKKANFCKDKLCPMCQWRRSLKNYLQLKKIVSQIDTKKHRLLLITLTVPNCDLVELRDTIKRQNKAFNLIQTYISWQNAFIGFYRTTEITYDESKDKPCNAHMHILVACEKDYFKKGSNIYITQQKLAEMWRKALKMPFDSPTIVDIRAVGKGKTENFDKDLNEVTKYVAKSTDYLDKSENPEEVIYELNRQLDNMRFMGMGGIFKEIAKQMKIDFDDDNLVNLDDDSIKGIPKEYAEMVHYVFCSGVYREIDVTTVDEYLDYMGAINENSKADK